MLFRFLLVVSLLSSISCDSTFRFGAVLSTRGVTKEMQEAKQGYEFYFDRINNETKEGFVIHGLNDDDARYRFKYQFIWREDESNAETHNEEFQKLISEDKVHFLGGSHAAYADEESKISDDSGVLLYHCCVEPNVYYDNDHLRVFGITASNELYTKNFVTALVLAQIGAVAMVLQHDDTFMRTTCEAANKFFLHAAEVRSITGEVFYFNRNTDRAVYFAQVAQKMKEGGVQALVACVSPQDGKAFVEALHRIRHPLKAAFITIGPTKQDWVDGFQPVFLSTHLYSGTQWHEKLKFEGGVLESPKNYSDAFRKKFETSPSSLSAGASAVGETLTAAIREAFKSCDISKTGGDVNQLLYNVTAISCQDGLRLGYDRVVHALDDLDVQTSFGRVKFNSFRRNIGLETVTTQVLEEEVDGQSKRVIEAVWPVSYASSFPMYPAKNHYVEDCLPGYYYNVSNPFNPCAPCPRGQSTTTVNARHCDSCPKGEYNDRIGQSTCVFCPPGTTTDIKGAIRRAECRCLPGYFSPQQMSGVECRQCPDGAECDGGTVLPRPLPGYWTDTNTRLSMYSCDPPDICLGGDDNLCEKGYTGRLCAECQDDYFSVIQRCHACVHSCLIVLGWIGLLVGWYVINVIVSRKVASLEMILGWAQLANIIGDVNLNWTRSVTTMFGVANLLDFDVDILEPSCLFEWGFKQNFIVQLCLPFVMSFMAASGFLSSLAAYYIIVKEKWIEPQGRSLDVLSFLVAIPEDREQLKVKWDATIASFLASVDITYVTIAKYCFDAFKCEDIAGVSVLREAPDVMCSNSAEHATLMVLAGFGIVFYVVGYLAFVSWKLYDLSNRAAFSDPITLRRFGFIYEKYELDYFFTPAIMIVRKLVFVLVLVYVNNPAFQIGMLAIVINASLMLHVYTAPYVDTYLDVLFSFLLATLMFEAFGGLMFYSDNLPEDNRRILEWIVLTSMLVLTVVFFVIFLLEIMKKYHQHYVKQEHLKHVKSDLGHLFRGLFSSRQDEPSMSKRESLEPEDEVSFELLETFQPAFVYRCMKREPGMIKEWDQLTNMLKDFMSDQSETSYLSVDPVAKFWRKLVDRFPELVDFLAVADDDTRSKFNDFAIKLYRNFYLSNKVAKLPLMDVLNWRDYAPMAQWLAICPSADREFFLDVISHMFRINGHADAADTLARRIQHGGSDPQLQRRASIGLMTRKKKQILRSLNSGSHPLYHSASSVAFSSSSMLNLSIGKSKERQNREKSKKMELETPRIDEHQMSDVSQIPLRPITSKKLTASSSKRTEDINNGSSFKSQSSESSSKSKSVRFSTDGSMHDDIERTESV